MLPRSWRGGSIRGMDIYRKTGSGIKPTCAEHLAQFPRCEMNRSADFIGWSIFSLTFGSAQLILASCAAGITPLRS